MSEVVFIYEGRDIIIQCNKNQTMEDICKNFSTKINSNINSLIFLFGGNKLNFAKTFVQTTKENKITVLVYKNENDMYVNSGKLIANKIMDVIILLNKDINNSLIGLKNTLDNVMNEIINKKNLTYSNNKMQSINTMINDINEKIKKMYNQLNQIKTYHDSVFKIYDEKKITNNSFTNELGEGGNIDIEILDKYLCTINYKFSNKKIKDLGFLVKIPIANKTSNITGFISKFYFEETILNNIQTINVFNKGNLMHKINCKNSEDLFIFSDEFLNVTYFEINNANFNFIDILDENKIPKKFELISYSKENNTCIKTQVKLLEKWGINIIYQENDDKKYANYKTSYCNIGLIVDNKLVGIHQKNNLQNGIAINIDAISKAIKLNYREKKKNNSTYYYKTKNQNLLNGSQISDLKKIGLELTDIKNMLVSPASTFVTPIWFYRTKHAWYWTPTEPDKNDLYKSNWMIIYRNNSLKVIGGKWDGIEPAEKNIKIINLLEATKMKYLI